MRTSAIWFGTIVVAMGCSSDNGSQRPEPKLPEGVETESGRVFTLDTSQPSISKSIPGAPSDYELVGELGSNDGQRKILLRPGANADPITIAASGWNLPPASASTSSGNMLVCWNRLTGPLVESRGMPHPSQGLPLFCRYWSEGVLGPEIAVAGDEAPSWLRNVSSTENGGFEVSYHRDQLGWLVGDPIYGDGIYARVFDGESFGEAFVISLANTE